MVPKIQILELGKVVLECHSAARLAYDKSVFYKPQFPSSQGVELLQLMQSSDPLFVVKTSRKSHYHFISGWRWLADCRLAGVSTVHVMLIDTLSDSDIQRRAWAYLLSHLLKTPHRDSVLSYACEVLDVIPSPLRVELLGNTGLRSAVAAVRHLSGETRAAVRNQVDKQKRNMPEPLSVLGEILAD